MRKGPFGWIVSGSVGWNSRRGRWYVPEHDGGVCQGTICYGHAIRSSIVRILRWPDVHGKSMGILEAFARVYYQIVQAVMPHGLPLSPRSIIDVSPTWYGNHSPSPTYSMSNHALMRLACIAGIPWLDWRLTCHADVDHAHPMEPSVAGGAKIAAGIAHSYGRIPLIAVAPESTSDTRHHESDGVRYIIETATNMRHIWGTAR
jgi:hypothetical protein